MLAALLGWVPVLGGILQSVLSYFTAKEDAKVKIDTNDVAVIQSRNQVIIATANDAGLRVLRDLAILLPVAYVDTYIWDRMMEIRHPELVWGVRDLNLPWETYLPVMAVYAFLFGLSWRGK